MARLEIAPSEKFEHRHAEASTTVLLAGVATFQVADSSPREMTEGAQIFVPANVSHTVANVGSIPAIVGCYYYPIKPPPPD